VSSQDTVGCTPIYVKETVTRIVPCSCRKSPGAFSLHPAQAMVGGIGRASGMPGKLHAVSLRLDISHGETGWTFKACHRSFFHLRQYHLNDFGNRTSGSFPHRWSARFTNGIASRATLARAWCGGFGRNLRRGQRRSGIRGRLCCLGDVRHLWYASHWKRPLAVSRLPW